MMKNNNKFQAAVIDEFISTYPNMNKITTYTCGNVCTPNEYLNKIKREEAKKHMQIVSRYHGSIYTMYNSPRTNYEQFYPRMIGKYYLGPVINYVHQHPNTRKNEKIIIYGDFDIDEDELKKLNKATYSYQLPYSIDKEKINDYIKKENYSVKIKERHKSKIYHKRNKFKTSKRNYPKFGRNTVKKFRRQYRPR